MLLTGKQIAREIEKGRILLDPFDPRKLNPNSYNLTLADTLVVYEKQLGLHEAMELRLKKNGTIARPEMSQLPFDLRVEEQWTTLRIPEDGLVLFPGILYLACTRECAGSDIFVPCIEGRSSLGRLGVFIHATAGFGDLGFSGPGRPAQWTCEVTVTHPVRIYAGIDVCQVVFNTVWQEPDLGDLPRYTGKYTGQKGPKPSGFWKDFLKEKNNG